MLTQNEAGLYVPDKTAAETERRAVIEKRLRWAAKTASRAVSEHFLPSTEFATGYGHIVVELMRQDAL